MPATLSGLRPLVPDDLEWVLHLCELRRKRIAGYAVRFWRPAPDARGHHRVFLSHQIQDPRVLSLRTDHGFVFAAPRADLLDIDDMALDDDDRWPDDGIRLLQAVLQRSDARFVCPVPEPARTQTAVAAGMQPAESWWHRDLPTTDPPTTATAPVDDPILDVPGASGRLVAHRRLRHRQDPPTHRPRNRRRRSRAQRPLRPRRKARQRARRSRRRTPPRPYHRPLRQVRSDLDRRTRIPPARPSRGRAALPGPHRTRGTLSRRDRQQRTVLRLDQDLHRPPPLRRHRRPTHLQRPHHRNRHHQLPTRPRPRPREPLSTH